MGKLFFILIVFFVCFVVSFLIYDKFLHPFFFKEELEEILEDAAETKIRKDVEEKANKIVEGDDAS